MQIRFDSCRIVSLLPPTSFYHSVSYEGCTSYLQNMVLRPISTAHHTEEKRKCIQSTLIWKQIGRLGGLDWKTLRTSRHILATVPDLTYVYMYISCTMMKVSQRLIYSRSLNSNLTDIFNFLTNFSVKESPSKKWNSKQHSQAFPWQTEWNSWTSKLPGYVCVQRSLHYRRLWFNRQQKFPTRSHSLTNDDRQKRR